MNRWRSYGWTYLIVTVALTAIDWVLGVLRFYWPGGEACFVAVNFPTGLGFLWLERQTSAWWQSRFGQLVNDEIGQVIAFGWMILCQAALYTLLINLSPRRRLRYKKSCCPNKSSSLE